MFGETKVEEYGCGVTGNKTGRKGVRAWHKWRWMLMRAGACDGGGSAWACFPESWGGLVRHKGETMGLYLTLKSSSVTDMEAWPDTELSALVQLLITEICKGQISKRQWRCLTATNEPHTVTPTSVKPPPMPWYTCNHPAANTKRSSLVTRKWRKQRDF